VISRSLPGNLEEVLLEVSGVLSGAGIRWVLVGGAASYLHGLDVEPRDLDVLVEEGRVYEADRLLASRFAVVRRVRYSSSRLYSSHYGVFVVRGVRVDVMADLEICGEHGCLKLAFDEVYAQSSVVEVGGAPVRLIPLEWQLVANAMIPGKEGRVRAILEALRARGVDRDALDSALSYAPAEVRGLVLGMLRSAGIQD